MKEHVLIFCSWLDIETSIGVFFIEQAELIKPDYEPILVVFKQELLSKDNFINRYLIQIKEKETKTNIKVLEIHYPYAVKFPKKVNRYFEKKALVTLDKFLKEKKIQLKFTHAQSLFDAGIWAYKFFKYNHTPYIITEHNQLTFRNINEEKSYTAINALNNAKKILVVSNDKIRQFAANGLFYDFFNIGNLINRNFKLSYNENNSSELRLITIGAFTAIKDQKTILKALKIIDDLNSRAIIFTWVGTDAWGDCNQNKLSELIRQFNFKNIEIILKPNLERVEVANELNNSDLFVFSSISEGMPVSVLEALACGLPVFTSNCGGVDEVINDTNGKIYPIIDYEKLSSLINEFMNKDLIFDKKTISQNAIEKFGEVSFKKNLLSIYNSIK